MRRTELVKRLRATAKAQGASVDLIREGGAHTVYRVRHANIVVPRHREIGERLAAAIIKQAEAAAKEGS